MNRAVGGRGSSLRSRQWARTEDGHTTSLRSSNGHRRNSHSCRRNSKCKGWGIQWDQEHVGSSRGEAQRKGRSQSRRALRRNGQQEGIRVPMRHSPRERHAKTAVVWRLRGAEKRKQTFPKVNLRWRRLLRGPWTARRSNQSILKDISPGILPVSNMDDFLNKYETLPVIGLIWTHWYVMKFIF